MAVSEQTPYKEYTANGSANSFALEFDCENQDHLIVLVDDVEPAIGSWSLTGGAVIFGTAPENGKKITIQRNTPVLRSTNFQSFNNSLRPDAINKDLDRVWLRLQEEDVAKFLLNQLINMNYKDLDEKGQNIRTELIDELTIQADELDQKIQTTASQLNSQIIQQGVSQQQLQNYYSFLQGQMANLSSDKNWVSSLIADASGKNQQQINDEYARRFATVADPRNFGSPNNGMSDDAQGIREAIAYLDSLGGGELYMVSNIGWVFKTLSENNADSVVLNSVIRVNLGNASTTLEVGTDMRSVFKVSDSYQGFVAFTGGIIFGRNIAEYGLYSDPNAYNPYMEISGIQLRGFNEAAASLNPYMSSFKNSHFSFSKKGLVLNNRDTTSEITSTELSYCYANGCDEAGFKVNNRMMYAGFQKCGVDDCLGIAYDLDLQGGSIVDCGGERVQQLLRFPNVNDAVSIRGLVGIGVGSLDQNNPAIAAIEFSGSGFVPNILSGVRLLNHPIQNRYRNKDLVVNVSSGKYPRVIIPDSCILRENTQVNIALGVTPIHDEPITFGVSRFERTKTDNLTPVNLKSSFDILSKNMLEFTHTIQLSDGEENFEKVIEKISGVGTFIIQGNAADNTKVKLRGARLGMVLRNCSATIILKNVCFTNKMGYNDPSLAQVIVINCREVIFDNVYFDSTLYTIGTAIRATDNSKVVLRNNTFADIQHASSTVYQESTGASITIEPRNTPPLTGQWMIGQRIKNTNIGTGNVIEWVRMRNSANTGDEWRAVTV